MITKFNEIQRGTFADVCELRGIMHVDVYEETMAPMGTVAWRYFDIKLLSMLLAHCEGIHRGHRASQWASKT